MTRQRQVILEELRRTTSHPTADDVYDMVRQRLPKVSLGTVYRNLDILSTRGLIRKLELGGTQRRFDGNATDHYHVRCIRCGRVDDVPTQPLTTIENALRKVTDYDIIGHQLEFIGLCPQCKKEAPGSYRSPQQPGRKEG